MKKYLLAYFGGDPAAMATMPKEEIDKVMAVWQEWGQLSGVTDLGAPFNPGGKAITSDGVTDAPDGPNGYSLIEAEDMDGALAMIEGKHPHLQMPGGKVVVHECGEM